MGSFRLGRIFGFEIRIDFSWFIIFFLILWTFTFAVFPQSAPGLPRGAYVAMGLIGTLLFFASLLTHELSHSFVARAKGIPVEGITLFIFGGMARTRAEAASPGDEFVIAGVGPLTSLGLGLVLGLVWWLGTSWGWSPAVTAVAQYVGSLNVLIAVFNLLPGFPLDGGRLFRAITWKLTGDLGRATRLSTTGGRWLGYLLVGLGLWQAFTGAVLDGLWLVFIGWFLRNAAASSYQQHVLLQVLSRVPAREAMTPHPETVVPDLSLQQVADEHFLRRRFLGYPVVEDGRTLGFITLDQVRAVPREQWPARSVRETMAPRDEAWVVRPDVDMSTVLERLEDSPVRRVLVERDGVLEGLITAADVAGWLRRVRALPGS